MDLGHDNRVWDLTVERSAPLRRRGAGTPLALASAGIPAVFPARGIGEYLAVDGAILSNIIYGGETREAGSWWRAGTPSTRAGRCRACATG